MFEIFWPTSIFAIIGLLRFSLKLLRFRLFNLTLVTTLGFIDFPNINFRVLGLQHL
jgi:hypothetical protein